MRTLAKFLLALLASVTPKAAVASPALTEHAGHGRARAHVAHYRPLRGGDGQPLPYRWLDTGERDAAGAPILAIDPASAELVGEEVVHNTITTVGRDFLHTQGYGTSPAANGLNYIALSDDAVTETSASTTLSNEIAANGLTRAIGAVAHTGGTNTTTVSKTFTCATSAQAAQKAALFTASSGGTMNHVLGFTQRSLQVGDTLQITFTITLG